MFIKLIAPALRAAKEGSGGSDRRFAHRLGFYKDAGGKLPPIATPLRQGVHLHQQLEREQALERPHAEV